MFHSQNNKLVNVKNYGSDTTPMIRNTGILSQDFQEPLAVFNIYNPWFYDIKINKRKT